MFKFKKHPHNLLLIVALLLFVAGVSWFNYSFDFQFYDTYVVASVKYFAWMPAAILVVFWLIYSLTAHILFSKALIWIHILLTGICTIAVLAYPILSTYTYSKVAGAPRRYYDYSSLYASKVFSSISGTITILLLILLLAQLIYLINLFAGLYKMLSTKHNK